MVIVLENGFLGTRLAVREVHATCLQVKSAVCVFSRWEIGRWERSTEPRRFSTSGKDERLRGNLWCIKCHNPNRFASLSKVEFVEIVGWIFMRGKNDWRGGHHLMSIAAGAGQDVRCREVALFCHNLALWSVCRIITFHVFLCIFGKPLLHHLLHYYLKIQDQSNQYA